MYTIGIIDDEMEQISQIRRTIKTNAPKDIKYDFKTYCMSNIGSNLINSILTDVIKDIEEQKINSLIIDYKIMIKTTKIKGTDIFKAIKDKVSKFPIIILTEIVEESITPYFIDADKIYRKRDFYLIEDEYSKEKVSNIFDSMNKYTQQKDKLQVCIEELKTKISSKQDNSEVINSILQLESELDDFIPIDMTQIDKLFDESKIMKVVSLIEKANNLIEVDDE